MRVVVDRRGRRWLGVGSTGRRGPRPARAGGTPHESSSQRSVASATRSSSAALVTSSTRLRTRPLSPSALSLDEHQLDRHLLQGAAQPGGIGAGRLQLPAVLLGLQAGTGVGQRFQRALPGHHAEPHGVKLDRSAAPRSIPSLPCVALPGVPGLEPGSTPSSDSRIGLRTTRIGRRSMRCRPDCALARW